MTARHYVALGLILGGIAAQAASVHSWNEVLSPAFVFGSFGVIGGTLINLFSPEIGRDPTSQDRRTDPRLS